MSLKAEEISHSRLIDIVSIGMAGLLWAFLPSDMTALITQYLADKFLHFIFQLPYSRQLEKEADNVGIMLAARVKFRAFCLSLSFSVFFMFKYSLIKGLF
jgi:predicted Zn-dependent protease